MKSILKASFTPISINIAINYEFKKNAIDLVIKTGKKGLARDPFKIHHDTSVEKRCPK